MSKKTGLSTLMILIACVAAFTAGVGASFWERVETVNVIFYTIFWGALLIALVWFGFESLMLLRTYRRTTGKRFDNASKITRLPRVEIPTLPEVELIDLDLETRKYVETLFYQIET
jgi:hypothetical protein